MGGKLFEAHGAKRVSTYDLEHHYKPELTVLFTQLGDVTYHFVDYVADKQSHGDMDVLVMDQVGLTEKVLSLLGEKGYLSSKNGNVLSFLYEGSLQVDLLLTPELCFDYSKHYFAYNDLGGMLGRMTRKLGLKHGWQGLEYQQYAQDHANLLATHFLTADHELTLELLGLDPQKYQDGFQSLEDVFQYVMTSPWFSSELFMMERLSSKDRNRDQKRNSFRTFEQYLKLRHEVKANYPGDKQQFVLSHFPELQAKLQQVNDAYLEKKFLAQKFNGALVMRLRPELKGRNLGDFLKNFMVKYTASEVLAMSDEDLVRLVVCFDG